MGADDALAALSGARVVILGGLGFIGSNLARSLVEAGAHVTLVDSLAPRCGGRLDNIAGVEPRPAVEIGDVVDATVLSRILSGADVVFNLVGQTSHLDSMQDPFTDLEANCTAQVAILEGLRSCAVLVLFWLSVRSGEADPDTRAYVALCVSSLLWLVLEVGVFASREVGRLAERNLMALAPLLFIGFALWLCREGPGSHWARSAVGLLVAVAVLTLPLDKLVTYGALPDAFTLIPLYHLRQLTSLRAVELAVSLGVGTAIALFVFLQKRALWVLPAIVLAALVGGSVASCRQVVAESHARQPRLVGQQRRWVDAAAHGPVTLILGQLVYPETVWTTLFWNRRIQSVYDMPGYSIDNALPQQTLDVRPDGELRPSGGPETPTFAVASLDYTLRGTLIATEQLNQQLDPDQHALGLWRVTPPLRVSTVTTGLHPNGDVDGTATLTVYGCGSGMFDTVLLLKEPQEVSA